MLLCSSLDAVEKAELIFKTTSQISTPLSSSFPDLFSLRVGAGSLDKIAAS